MPQLNPAPWLMIMLLSWMTLLALFSPKITASVLQNSTTTHTQTTHKTAPWNWPWA